MPPCNFAINQEKNDVTSDTHATKLQLADIRRAIPDAAFKKSMWKAYGYMVFDYSTWFGTVFLMHTFCSSEAWSSMPYWQQVIASIVYFNVAGFFMWCLFMIGHDCGHGVFSNSTLENDIIGHLTHASLLVPYYPWQVCSLSFFFSVCYLTNLFTCLYSYLIVAIICITITWIKTTLIHG
jgi:acyl-lipid omega-3 desaturase